MHALLALAAMLGGETSGVLIAQVARHLKRDRTQANRALKQAAGIGLNLTVQAGATSWGWSLGLVLAIPACTGS